MTDYITSHLWLVWTLACVLALILEMSTGTFYLLCFAVGAAVSIVFSLLAVPLWLQVLIFAVASIASILLVRPMLMKRIHPEKYSRVSNADALIGREGTVIEPITASSPGYVKIDGDEWKAIGKDGATFQKGDRVTVVHRESIIVTVRQAG